ncbi:MAG TPA: hypothetical protein VFQ41_20870 [Candidatus Angelobacter sp.]|nr:hypothetical protein [Candidatus Angelobacter sp.]
MLHRKVLFIAVLMCLLRVSSHAQQQQTVCVGTITPDGWVTLTIFTKFNFPPCPDTLNNVKIIEEIDTLVSGSSLVACDSNAPLPLGWVITDFITDFGDCSRTSNDKIAILNIIGDPIGATHQVCFPRSLIPPGWTTTGLATDFTRCGGVVNNNPNIAAIRRDSGADLSIAVSPTSASVAPGGSLLFTVSLARSGGLSDLVTLSASTPPSGVSITFSPNSTTASSSTMTIATSAGTPPGSFNIWITAVAGVFVRSALASVSVQPGGSFALAASPNPQVLVPGASNAIDVSIIRAPGFGSSVALSVSDLPAGVTGTFSPISTTGNISTLTLTATNAVALGSFSITITGTSGRFLSSSTSSTVTTSLVPAWWEAVYQILTH